ncbi:MAG: neutral/alkaline non-lysosomal ceramidase N-terminal domain-containing protein [Polyangiaceae bacterium]
MRLTTFLLVLLLVVTTSACQKHYSTAPVTPHQDAGPMLLVGAATTDITPPPGLALFGHGPEGRVAAGTLLRLRCQAFALARGEEAVALVTCDLGAPSLELQRAIVRAASRQGVPIGADRLLLMATHTHAGPAHFFGAKQYSSGFGARIQGYDPNLVEWLAERIGGAVRLAWGRRVPSCASWADDAVYGLTRNRSYPAFATNGAVAAALIQAEVSREDVSDASPTFKAVDPTLSVLRLQRCDGQGDELLGALAVFGMHPTAIPNDNDLYHGDVFGFAARAVERELQGECRDEDGTSHCPVIGIANGVEGDVSATWGYQGPREARRLGDELGSHILRLLGCEGDTCSDEHPPSHDVALRAAYRELRLPGAIAASPNRFFTEVEEGPAALGCFAAQAPQTLHLCPGPAIGTPAAGGAEDGPTRLRIFGQMKEGYAAPKAATYGCQGAKHVLRPPSGVTESRILGPDEDVEDQCNQPSDDGLDFPTTAPISLVQIGDRLIAAAPAELTTAVGYRLRERLTRYVNRPGSRIREVVITGLTNTWIQYITTEPEYAKQHYEGASTLYGPHSEQFLSNHFLCLANWLYDGGDAQDACSLGQPCKPDRVSPVGFDPPLVDILPPAPEGSVAVPGGEELAVKGRLLDGLEAYAIEWRGASPDWLRTRESLRVSVVFAAGEELVDDDDGVAMEIRHLGGERWRAVWYPELGFDDPVCGRDLRFLVDGQVRYRSRTFKAVCPERGESADFRQGGAP